MEDVLMQGPTIVEGKQLAVVGEAVICNCPGGPHRIVTGADKTWIYGKAVARVGDKSSCGATITTGTNKFMIHGVPAAFDGSLTFCGGHVRTRQDLYPSNPVPTASAGTTSPTSLNSSPAVQASTTSAASPSTLTGSNARPDTQPCHHPDQALEVAAYIVQEIQRNATSEAVRKMKRWNSVSASNAAEEWRRELEDVNLTSRQEMARNLSRPNFREMEYVSRNSALLLWTSLVRQNGDWDHKPKIRENEDFESLGISTYRYHHKYGEYEYFYDIWSNVHYRYVGLCCGFSRDDLLDGAGREQIGTDLLHLQLPTNREDINGPGMRRYDDTTDNLSIRIGFGLFDRYPDPSHLTKEIVMSTIASAPYPLKEGAKVRHDCRLARERRG